MSLQTTTATWELGRHRRRVKADQRIGRGGRTGAPTRVALGRFPTRLERLPELGEHLGVDLWIKHEFEADAFGSGNKVRKLEFLIPEVVEQEYTGVVSDGTTQSNSAMAIALYAPRFNLSVDLVLYGSPARQGNYLDILRSGAAVTLLPEWFPDGILRAQRGIVAAARADGRRLYTVPTGATSETTVFAGIDLVSELAAQEEKVGRAFDYVVIPTASGGTQAGLEIGRLIHHCRWTLIAVGVANNAVFFREVVNSLVRGPLLSPLIEDCREHVTPRVYMGALGQGYGVALPGTSSEIKQLRMRFGLVLDSVYTYKAYVGMRQLIASGEIPCGSSVVFVHTGGHNERFVDI